MNVQTVMHTRRLLGVDTRGDAHLQPWQVYSRHHYESDGLRNEAQLLWERKVAQREGTEKVTFLDCVREICEAKVATMSEEERREFLGSEIRS